MYSPLKALFRNPTAEELRKLQLEEAQRALLHAEAELEAAMANRSKLKARVARLSTATN